MKRFFLAPAVVAWLAVHGYSEEPSGPADTALLDLDKSFIRAHLTAKKLDLETGGPIIYVSDGQLVLVRDGAKTKVTVILADYETYKTFAHMPVTIYLMLGPPGAGPLDAKRLEQLRGYRAKMDAVEKHLGQIGLQGASLQRQKAIVSASRLFLDKVIGQEKCDTEELYAFTRSMAPLIRANIYGAAKSQLDAMHRQVMAWKKEMDPKEWKKLRTAVKGAVLARHGNCAKQYFERLLNIKSEGMRLAFMEMYFPPTPMLTLLATRSVDRGISIAIFDNPDRMFRDVLADAATAYIKKLNFD